MLVTGKAETECEGGFGGCPDFTAPVALSAFAFGISGATGLVGASSCEDAQERHEAWMARASR